MMVIDGVERPVARGLLDPERAFLAGKLQASDLEQLKAFARSFPVDPAVTLEVAQEVRDGVITQAERGGLSNEEVADVAFLRLLPRLYRPDAAEGWDATLTFAIEGAGDYTVGVHDGEARVEKGRPDSPDALAEMDLTTLLGILNFSAMENAGNLPRIEIDDSEFLDDELTDDQLEAVSGGKGCGAAASGGTACGADACGGALGGGTACGAAACGMAAVGGGVCGADACGAATGVGTGCVAAACGAAACGGDACGAAVGASGCGAAACGAAAGVGGCAGAACGADAGVGACAGNACGAALGAGVCAGNACGVDVLAGADVGPCGINVIPGFPGI